MPNIDEDGISHGPTTLQHRKIRFSVGHLTNVQLNKLLHNFLSFICMFIIHVNDLESLQIDQTIWHFF